MKKSSNMAQVQMQRKGTKMKAGKSLIEHWWQYYSAEKKYSQYDMDCFQKILKRYGPDRVMDLIATCYIARKDAAKALLKAIRSDRVKELFDTIPYSEDLDYEVEVYFNHIKEKLIEVISATQEK